MTEPTQPVATFKEGQVDAAGFSIRYLEAVPAAPAATVVILEALSWESPGLRDALAEQYRVVALQLPGFGSSAVNSRSHTVPELANTAARAIGKLVSEKYTLVGASFGANVTLWQALQAPDPVEALVLISPTAIHPTGDLPEPVTGLLAHPENAANLPPVDSAITAKEQVLVRRLGGGAHDAELAGRLAEIHCPTLVMFGTKDRLVSYQAGSIYCERIPYCNLSIVYDAGHVIAAERPQALISAVADYVERRETYIVGRQNALINP